MYTPDPSENPFELSRQPCAAMLLDPQEAALRDSFAMEAMKIAMTEMTRKDIRLTPDKTLPFAERCYELADAMMEARSK